MDLRSEGRLQIAPILGGIGRPDRRLCRPEFDFLKESTSRPRSAQDRAQTASMDYAASRGPGCEGLGDTGRGLKRGLARTRAIWPYLVATLMVVVTVAIVRTLTPFAWVLHISAGSSPPRRQPRDRLPVSARDQGHRPHQGLRPASPARGPLPAWRRPFPLGPAVAHALCAGYTDHLALRRIG